MKIKKLLFGMLILAISCFIVGCAYIGKGKTETLTFAQAIEAGMDEKFYLIIEDAFALEGKKGGEVVVVGYNQNSELINGTEVDIISPNGRIQSQITDIEVHPNGLVDRVPAGSSIGVILSNVTYEQVNAGDIIVLREKGYVSREVDATIVAGLSEDEIVEGMKVYTSFLDEYVEATVALKEKPSESGQTLHLLLRYEDDIPFVDHQVIIVYDENGKHLGAGRVFGKEEYRKIETNLKK